MNISIDSFNSEDIEEGFINSPLIQANTKQSKLVYKQMFSFTEPKKHDFCKKLFQEPFFESKSYNFILELN